MKALLTDWRAALTAVIVVTFVVLMAILSALLDRPQPALGSARPGDEYQSTTTPRVADVTNLCPARSGMASSTTGVLGAVNVLVSGTGTLTLYDATTTDITQRAHSTSSAILAEFPSYTAGSYHFDVGFTRGLLVDYTTNVASTTISYRCEG